MVEYLSDEQVMKVRFLPGVLKKALRFSRKVLKKALRFSRKVLK